MSKSCQKSQNSEFQSQLFMSKVIQTFLNFFFIEEYDFRGTLFVIDIQFLTTFTQLNARLKKNFSWGWLLVLGLKECLVECATLCVKSEVILAHMYGTHQGTDFLTMTEYVVHILNEFKFIRVAIFFQRCLNSLQDSIGSFDQAHAGCQET